MSFFEPKTPKNQGITAYNRRSEVGSAIMWIFVMIALFAALGYALSQGTRGGEQNLSDYQVSLAASEILEQMGTLKEAVKFMRINDCDDTQISFDNTVIAGYTNTNAPGDESCHVFRPNGAGMSYRKPNSNFLDSAFSAQDAYGEIFFSGNMRVNGLGCDNTGGACQELIAFYPFIEENICLKLNEVVNDINIIPQDVNNAVNYSSAQFDGSYTSSDVLDGGAAILDGRHSGCFEGAINPSGGFHFYQVLISR